VRLASLTLQGFKSFGNRVSIEFAPGVTAIIGPNGSGKSNVIDALRWTTGGGRAREFRAADKTDLIFHGASGKRSVGLAEVEVELRDDRASVKVYRSIDREGTTRLRLNGRSARLLDVEEALTGSGLGRSGLAIIGQGEVSQVLMADPQKLLDYVAEAAGVARLAGRRDQTVLRLETAAQHLVRLEDVLNELASRCSELEAEAEGARLHSALSAEHLSLRFTLASLRENALVTELQALETKRGLLEASLVEGRERLADLREVGKAAAGDRDRAEERYREAAAQLEYRRGNLRVAEERLARLSERSAALDSRTGSAKAELEKLAQATPPAPPDESPREVAKRAAETSSSEREAAEELSTAAEGERAHRAEFERLRAAYVTFERETAGLASRREAVQTSLAQVEAQLGSLDQDTEDDLTGLAERQASAGERLAAAESRLEAHRAALQSAHERHALAAAEAMSRGRAASRSRQAFEARRGFAQGPRNALDSGIAGVIGAVADLLSVAPEHQEAIGAALGRRAEYVVVDDAGTAQAVLRHVRQAGGFVTVLPLDLLRAQPNRGLGSAGGMPGVVAPATDLIVSDPRYETLFEMLLGGTLVVSDLDAATAIAKLPGGRPRLVTREGEIVEPTGAMSGGKRSQHAAVLGAAAELEEAEAAAAASSASAEEAAARLATEQALARGLLAELQTVTEEHRAAAQALAAARERRAGRDSLHADLSARRRQLRADLEALPEGPAGDGSDLAEAVATAEAGLTEAVAALEKARSKLEERRLAAAEAQQAVSMSEERWRLYAEARARFAAGEERAEQLRAEIELMAESGAVLARELTEATAARDLAKSAVPADLTPEEGALAEARKALSTTEALLTAETEAQARRAQELEESKVQAARRETALELAQEELRSFSPGIELVDLSERAARARLREVSEALEALGAVNHRAVTDLAEVVERKENLEVEAVQAALAVTELQAALERIDKETSARLNAALQRLQASFSGHVRQLFGEGGQGGIEVEAEGNRPTGLRIRLQPPGKQTQSLHLLSVGERTMGALAFLFSLIADDAGGLPVAVLDEVDAPLDEANIRRYGSFVRRLAAEGTQFVLITHQKATFEIAETLWGITSEQGVSRVFSIRREEAASEAAGALR